MNKYVKRPLQRGDLIEYVGAPDYNKPRKDDYGMFVRVLSNPMYIAAYWWNDRGIRSAHNETVRVLSDDFCELFPLAYPEMYDWLCSRLREENTSR